MKTKCLPLIYSVYIKIICLTITTVRKNDAQNFKRVFSKSQILVSFKFLNFYRVGG